MNIKKYNVAQPIGTVGMCGRDECNDSEAKEGN